MILAAGTKSRHAGRVATAPEAGTNRREEILQGGAGDAAAADLDERVPGLSWGWVPQLGQGRGVFERIRRVRQGFECGWPGRSQAPGRRQQA